MGRPKPVRNQLDVNSVGYDTQIVKLATSDFSSTDWHPPDGMIATGWYTDSSDDIQIQFLDGSSLTMANPSGWFRGILFTAIKHNHTTVLGPRYVTLARV